MKKTIHLFSLVLLLLYNSSYAQMPACQWAHNSRGYGANYLGTTSATDANVNLIVAGYYNSPNITFGTYTLNNLTGTSNDVYVVKYSASGNVLWARSYGGTSNDYLYKVATDTSGNVFVTGYFQSNTITFGTNTLITASAGTYNYFIVKLSPSGNVLWASSVGGASGQISGTSLSTDLSGNVFVTGNYNCPAVSFGNNTLTNTGNNNSTNIFIVKYSPTGAILWASSAGGAGIDAPGDITTDALGNVFLAGYFYSPSIVFGTTTLTSSVPGNYNMFVVKFSNSGTTIWGRTAMSSYLNSAACLGTDNNGNVYVTGHFSDSTITFGSTTITKPARTGSAIFVVKYSSTGNALWANSGISSSNYGANAMSTDANGNTFITGYFEKQSIAFGTKVLTNNFTGTSNIFMVKYDALGSVVWASSVGGAGKDYGCSVSNDLNGNVYITGNFNSSNITFSNTTLSNTSGGNCIVFVAKLMDGITSIRETQQIENQISIYPNPFNTQATLSFSEVQTNSTVKVIDLFGHEIMVIPNVNGKELLIEKGELKSGIYFVQIMDEKKSLVSKKMIVE